MCIFYLSFLLIVYSFISFVGFSKSKSITRLIVFDRNITSVDEAKNFFVKYWDNRVSVQDLRVLDWTPRYTKTPWVGNVVSIGLSAGFIEPLESSAISQGVLQTFLIMNLLGSWQNNNEEIAELYNDKVNAICDNILDFVSVHYYVPKDDTPFWKDLKENRNSWMTDSLKASLNKWSKRLPLALEFDQDYSLFTADNWVVTLHGLGLLDVNSARREYNMLPPEARAYCDAVVNEQRHLENTLPYMPHKEGLERFVKKYKETYSEE